MKKIACLTLIALSSISTTSWADNFSINANDPQNNHFVFHDKRGAYNITANTECNGKEGGRICITFGEGTDCNVDAPPGIPNRFSIYDNKGQPITTVTIRTSPRSKEGISCGTAEPGVPRASQKIII